MERKLFPKSSDLGKTGADEKTLLPSGRISRSVRTRERKMKTEISEKEASDIRMLMKFAGIYCRENHDGEKRPFSFKRQDLRPIEKKEILLCVECTRLLTYGLTMRLKCPHDPKPMCKKCQTPCYHGEYKERIRDVMKFSGIYLVKHGRIDLLYHVLV